jgi:phycocyanin-associated rod protein
MLGERYFQYEVEGLRQSDATDNSDYSIRSSATTLIRVPYNRMNEEMQRINRMGGRIVNIRPWTAEALASAAPKAEAAPAEG